MSRMKLDGLAASPAACRIPVPDCSYCFYCRLKHCRRAWLDAVQAGSRGRALPAFRTAAARSCGRRRRREWAGTSGRSLIAEVRRRRRAARLPSPSCVNSAVARTSRAFSRARCAMAASPFLRDQFGADRRAAVGRRRRSRRRSATSRNSLDALADQRRDLAHLLRVDARSRRAWTNGQQQLRRVRPTGMARMCSAFSQTALGSKGSSSVKLTTALLRLMPSSEKASISSSRVTSARDRPWATSRAGTGN